MHHLLGGLFGRLDSDAGGVVSLFAGVDGGGTSTRVVIVDGEGREVARGEAPGAVVTVMSPEDAAEAVAAAIREAIESAALERITRDASLHSIVLPLDGLWAGLAGAGSIEAAHAVRTALIERGLAHRITVGTDVRAAYEDAFPDGDGVLLIAGTGSVALGMGSDGGPIQVGGWGKLLGDEGSGYWIGMKGLQHVMAAYDGRSPQGYLYSQMLEATGVRTPSGLVDWVEAAKKREIAALAPLVIASSGVGDPAAEDIVATAVIALVSLVEAVFLRGAGQREDTKVVLWGGLIADSGPLAGRVSEALIHSGFNVFERKVDAPLGASRLALRS